MYHLLRLRLKNKKHLKEKFGQAVLTILTGHSQATQSVLGASLHISTSLYK